MSLLRLGGTLAAVLCTSCTARRVPEERLEVVVVYQGPLTHRRDPRVPAYLRRSAHGATYAFQDAALWSLAETGYRSLELPDHSLLRVLPLGYAPDGTLRLEVALLPQATPSEPAGYADKAATTGATVVLEPGAALTIGGQPYLQGSLLVSVTRLPVTS